MNRLPTLSDSAKQIGVSKKRLFAELRRLKVIDDKNFAHHQFQQKGFFVVEQRTYAVRKTNTSTNYWITAVTEKGLIYLREIANAMAENGQMVVAKHHETPNQRNDERRENSLRSMEPHATLGYTVPTARRNR